MPGFSSLTRNRTSLLRAGARAMLERPEICIVCAVLDSQFAIGYATFGPLRATEDTSELCDREHTGSVYAIAVQPPHRRRGVGRLMLNAIVDIARQSGLTHLTMAVPSDDLVALGFAEGLGFREIGDIMNVRSQAAVAQATCVRKPPSPRQPVK